MWYWFTDIIIPLFTTGLGILTKRRPPEYGKSVLHRTKRSRASKKTWDFTSRRLGELWFKIGIVLVVSVLLHRLFSNQNPVFISAINIAAALACLVAAFPIVERELRKKYDENGNEKEAGQ